MGSVHWRSRLRGILGSNIFFSIMQVMKGVSLMEKNKTNLMHIKKINKFKYNDNLIYTTNY